MYLFRMIAALFFPATITLHGALFDLGGVWDVAPMPGEDWSATAEPAPGTSWHAAALPAVEWTDSSSPGLASSLQTAVGVWARRIFVLAPEQAQHDAVLRWEVIRWGFSARINGTHIGGSELYSPGALRLPRGALRAGTNELLLAVRGWSAVPRGAHTHDTLVPVGAARYAWGSKRSGVWGPVALEMYDGVRVRSMLARPDTDRMRVQFAVHLEGADERPRDTTIAVHVCDVQGAVMAHTSAAAVCTGSGRFVLDVPLAGAALWAPNSPVLYTARATLSGSGVQHTRTITFGMRTFTIRDGRFCLNGVPYPLRGSNLLMEWYATPELYEDRGGCLTRLLVDDARRMHANTFRTHTMPPSHRAAEICDAGGTLLLAESPLTYNYGVMRFSPAEEACYRSNAVAMCTAWVEELANHPSIIMWVSSNEPVNADEYDQYAWDIGTLIPAIKAVDPTRPVMRSGEASPDVQDTHCYAGYWGGAAGEFEQFARWRATTRDEHRPIMNSEYIEGAPPARRFLWSGAEDGTPRWPMIYAMVGMEQTETLRRLGYDGILPYMYHGWTRGAWRADAPTPMFAALRSALAPVAVSLDLADRNAAAGSVLTVPVHVMNDHAAPVQAHLACYVCDSDPAFATDAQVYEGAQRVAALELRIPAHGVVVTNVAFPLPGMEGHCWCAAVLRPAAGAPVMSQRPLHVFDTARVAGALSGITARVVGADAAMLASLRRYGLNVRESVPFGPVEGDVDVVLVCRPLSGIAEETQIQWLHKYLSEGGSLVLLTPSCLHVAANAWLHIPTTPAGERIEYIARPHRCSSVFPSPHSSVPGLWHGLRDAHLVRWNGLLNAVCMACLDADWLDTVPPATMTDTGPMPRPDAVIIEGEAYTAVTFRVDARDAMFTTETGDGAVVPRRYRAWRNGAAGLLCTRAAPAAAYEATYTFRTEGAAQPHVLWVREQMRRWSSPFTWRVDEGAWHDAGTEEQMVTPALTEPGGPTFAWTRLGTADLAPGLHRLDIRVTQPREDGLYLLAFDCFVLAPQVSETLALSGERRPLIARRKIGSGMLYITTLLFDGRLVPDAACYDPAAERMFVNLVRTAATGR